MDTEFEVCSFSRFRDIEAVPTPMLLMHWADNSNNDIHNDNNILNKNINARILREIIFHKD